MEQLGNSFPKKGHLIIWDGFSFELMRVKNSEIKEVRIKSLGDHLIREDREETTSEENSNHHKVVGAK
jgi:hypothetical protein